MTRAMTQVWARIARNSGSLFAATAVTAVANVVSVPVLYARLGEGVYGVWALLSGVVGVAALADFGLGAAQVREVALAVHSGDGRRAGAVLALGAIGGACLGTLALALVTVGWPVVARVFVLGGLAEAARGCVLLMLAAFVLDSVFLPWRAILEGHQHYGTVGLITGITAVVGAGGAVAAVLSGGGLVGLGASVTATSMVRAALLVAMARRRVPGFAPSPKAIRWSDVTAVVRYSLPVQASNAGAAVNNEMDRLVLGGVADLTTVAGFDLGSRVVNLLRMLPSFVMTALFPAATTLYSQDGTRRLDRLYWTATGYLTAFSMVAAAALMVSAEPLVRLWLGKPVPSAAATIAILAPGYAASMAAAAAAMVTRAEGFPGRETRSTLLAAVLNLALTVPLLRLVGPLGVPLATTVVLVSVTGYFFVYFHRGSRRPLRPLIHNLWPPVIAAAAAGALTWYVHSGLPDGAGRAGAAMAVFCRGGLTLLVAAVVLAALGFIDITNVTPLPRNIAKWRAPDFRATLGRRK